MRIAGRLALHDDALQSPFQFQSPARRMLSGYHGADVVVDTLSEAHFEAAFPHYIPSGTMVRLRLPGSGVMIARVTETANGRLNAAFINPVSEARLCKTFGWQSQGCVVAA